MSTKNNKLPQWVDAYTADLYNWAYHKTSDSELAKDLVQDTFLAASEKIDSFKEESSPKTWLNAILNHKIIDHYRKKVKQPLKLDTDSFSNFFSEDGSWKQESAPKSWGEDEPHLLDDYEFQLALKNCMDALPENWSICVKLKYLSDKKGDEICQELEISTTNYWQIVHRAKVQLRNCIETNWFQQQ